MNRFMNRLDKLERWSCRGADCDAGPTLILSADEGSGARVPPDAARCPKCGQVHVLVIEEIVEGPGAQPEDQNRGTKP